MEIESDLQTAMIDMYKRAGKETGYWGYYFLRSVKQHGGIATAKRMLRPGSGTTKGFTALINAKRADLSLEALILKPLFRKLFTKTELQEAKKRLDKLPKSAFPRPILPDKNFPESAISQQLYKDGAVRKVEINSYERDPKARKACLQKHGTRCAVCKISFEENYGLVGKDFIHVHHIDPLGRRRRAKRIDPIKDLIPICPNCHAMLHTSNPPLSISELKEIIIQITSNK